MKLPRILLVEDNDADADLVAELLPQAEIDRVSGLRRALEPRRDSRLTLLDLGLPESSGLETLRRYRSERPAEPVVVLTGVDDDALGREAIRLGAQDYLSKNHLTAELLSRTIAHAWERHRLSQDLQQSEERWRALMQAAPDAILEIDREGRVVWSNHLPRAFPEDLGGGRWTDHLPDKEKLAVEAALARVFEAGVTMTFESQASTRSGDEIWHHVSMGPVLRADGTVGACVAVFRDVSSLHRARERFKRALEAAPGGMLLVDAEGTIVTANATVATIFGFEVDELIGKPIELLVPVDLRRVTATDGGKLRLDEHEVTGLRKDGSQLPVRIGLTPIRTKTGPEVLCSVTDVSARRALEEQLRQAQKMEAVGRLAGGIAHDFNNVLTAILSFGSFVAEALPEEGTVRDDMEEVLNAARRAATLTSQLLAFSRRQPIAPRSVTLGEVVGGMERMLRRIIGEDVLLETHLAPACNPVEIDPGVFEHVLVNLAVNARDAMPHGGRLTIACDEVDLGREVLEAAGMQGPAGLYVRLRVEDTGAGMAPEVQKRIFEPFFTTKPAGRGTGLGLATVYGIVAQAQGFIQVESAPERGTRFDIFLPPSGRQPDENEVLDPPHSGGGHESILVVEDDPAVRTLVVRSLERSGYRVFEAADGEEALAIAEAHAGELDLVITDIVMPRMNGAELAERLTAWPHLAILFTTGYAPESIAARGVVAVAGELLRKPFSPQELTKHVRRLLDARTARPS